MTRNAQRRVVVEYLQAIMQKRISFRNAEERKKGAERMIKEATQFRALFQKLSSVRIVPPLPPFTTHTTLAVHFMNTATLHLATLFHFNLAKRSLGENRSSLGATATASPCGDH